MKYLYRQVDKELFEWKANQNRKPLLIRGARQIGKSSSIRQLGKTFEHYIEINFENSPQFVSIFESEPDINQLCALIEAESKIQISEGQTLLFLDEVQACPAAIAALRYFYEKKPYLHVVATGSLLEFAIAELPTFGVGRISSLYMYPFSFEEFMLAMNESRIYEMSMQSTDNKALNQVIHQKLNKLFKAFMVVGGMPEAVKTYVEKPDWLAVAKIQAELMTTFEDDFGKYKKRVSAIRIREVFRMVVAQTGQVFSYNQSFSGLTNLQIKDSLDLLEKAGLIRTITHSASNGIPLGSEINPKKRKFIFFDTGLLFQILGLPLTDLLISNDWEVINKGAIAEVAVGLELIKYAPNYQKYDLFFWQRDKAGSQAEVDYVIQKGDKLIPIEVKAGTRGSMQSMFLFLNEKQRDFGIRISQENFGVLPQVKIIPIYALKGIM